MCCGNESGHTCGADPPPVEVCGQNHKRKRNTIICKNKIRKALEPVAPSAHSMRVMHAAFTTCRPRPLHIVRERGRGRERERERGERGESKRVREQVSK